VPPFEYDDEEARPSFSWKTGGRILLQTRPHWRWVVGFLLATTLVSFQDAYFTFLGKRIIDEGIAARDPQAVIHIAVLYAGVLVVQAVAVFALIFLASVLGERVQYDLRRKMFDHLQDLSFSYYDRTPVGWVMARVTSDSERIAQLVTWGLLDSTWGVLNIATAMSFMVLINGRMALIVLAIIPVLLIVAGQFQKRILGEFRTVRKANARITAAYNENITGVRVVKALGREQANLEEFGRLSSAMYRSSYRAAWLSALFLPMVQMISALALGGVIWYGGLQATLGGISIGGIQAFIGYITLMLWPVQDLARVYAELQHAIASAERVFSLVDTPPAVADRPGASDPGSVLGKVEFDHVSFHYEDGKPVLSDFSLTVEPGETIALVGPTGGGKSTIVNLLCRFYEPQGGTIRIGGRDYTELTLHALQSRLGVVLQTPHLFSGTARENIRYGRLEATDEEVEQAAEVAGAQAFIERLDMGYDTDVGEGGGLLSVGQKQLISLARAASAHPEIFIMDEATSSVDTLTEAMIQRGMERLMEGRTSFIIAHRLSTIKRADRILVIDSGRVVEMGSHAELLRQRGRYYNLYTRQFRRQLERDYDLASLVGASP
jgi:ATP-binding cassette subfamily B protein